MKHRILNFGGRALLSVNQQYAYSCALLFISSAVLMPTPSFGNPQSPAGQTPGLLDTSGQNSGKPSLKIFECMLVSQKAKALLIQGNYEEAARLLGAACESNPEFATLHEDYGTVLRLMGQTEKAQEQLLKATELDNRNVRAWLNLWLLYENQGKTQDAEKAFEKYLQLNPTEENTDELKNQLKAQDLIVRLPVHLRHQDFAGALSLTKQASELQPSSALMHYLYGLIATLVDQNELANSQMLETIKFGKIATEKDKNNSQVWLALGGAYGAIADFKSAAAALEECLRLKPDSPDAQKIKLYLHDYQTNNPPDAASFNRASALDYVGITLMGIKDYSQAVTQCKEASDLVPSYAVYQYDYGTALLKAGQKSEATQCFRKTVELNNDFTPAWMALAAIYRSDGNLEEAKKAYQECVRIYPEGPEKALLQRAVDSMNSSSTTTR